MGALVDGFGGKINGELIRASDWNGMLAAVEALVNGLQQSIEARLSPLEASVSDLNVRVTTLETKVADLEALAAVLRARFRRLSLTAGASVFAIGQRGLISATVANLDDAALQIDAALRPWVDFVTVWGTLSPAPGFVTRSGTGGRTMSVQVNTAGQASVLLQADHAAHFSEADHLEVESALSTRIQVGVQELSIGESILTNPTPASVDVKPAFRAITQAYGNTATRTMQRYLDSYYVQEPSRVAVQVGGFAPTRWTDYLATVLAFVKADDDPLSPDGAMASASIQVTFRDWVVHWIVDDFLPDFSDVVADYRNVLPGLIREDLHQSVQGVLGEVEDRVRTRGVLGGQRELGAVREAVRSLNVPNPPVFLGDALDAVASGIAAQQAVSFAQAVTPIAGSSSTARAIADSSARATGEATRVGTELTVQFQTALGVATQSLRDQVKVDQQVFHADLLRDDGPIATAQKEARDVRGSLESVNRALTAKADLQFVTDFVRQKAVTP